MPYSIVTLFVVVCGARSRHNKVIQRRERTYPERSDVEEDTGVLALVQERVGDDGAV